MPVVKTAASRQTTIQDIKAHRRVVVPDRTMRQTGTVSPIVNATPAAKAPVKATVKPKQPHTPVTSHAVHKKKQIVQQKQADRLLAPKPKPSAAVAMTRLLDRHNDLPNQLARTAGRSHLLMQALELERYNNKWHRRLFAGLTG